MQLLTPTYKAQQEQSAAWLPFCELDLLLNGADFGSAHAQLSASNPTNWVSMDMEGSQ